MQGLVIPPLGRLFQTSGGSAGVTQFLYDGDELVGEYGPAGNMNIRYIHGAGVDDPVIWNDGPTSGWRRGLMTDHQGSVIAVTDMNGNPIAINAYDAWGIPNTTNQGRFGYTGQAWIPELGMWYYKARIYSPTLGRFMQTDPVGYEDEMNLYAYVGGDPVNRADPTGRYQCSTAANCQIAAQGIAQLRAVRDHYASARPGSNIPRSALGAAAVNRVLSSLGQRGDGGVTIQEGNLSGGDRGEYDRESNTITLDRRQIESTGASIGEVLAHEGQHYRERNDNLGPIAAEVRPVAMQFIVAHALRGGSRDIQGVTGREYVFRRLRYDYCHLADYYCIPHINRVMNEELLRPF